MADSPSSAVRRYREFDDVFQHVGSFSRYQRVLYFGVSMMIYTLNGQFTALVFAMGTPQFHCATPNNTCEESKCCTNCTEYVFDGPYHSTVSEWNLICDRAYLGATLQSCYFAGMLVGSFINGMISDAFGRKNCMMISYVLVIIAATASSFVDCISFYAFLQFVIGFTLTGTMLVEYIYGMEIVGPAWRTLAGSCNDLCWQTFIMLNAALAYLVRDWRFVVLVFTLPGLVILPFWKLIPESPRWLVAHGRLEEALAVLMKFGGKNGKPVDSEALRTLIAEVREDQIEREKEQAKKHTPLDLVRTPKLRKWTFILCYNWFVVGMVYFGVFIFVSQLAGNIYVNYIIMAAITMFGRIPVTWFLWNKIGRRLSHASFIVLAGTLLLIVLAFYKDYPLATTGISIMGYFFINGNFGNIYIITSELFPTVLRNTALGTGSTFARVGAILAPYIAMTGQLPGLSLAFPVTLFGVIAVVAGLLMYFIPETLGTQMRQTIEAAENGEDNYAMPCCGKNGSTDQEGVTVEEGDAEKSLMNHETDNNQSTAWL